MAMDAFDLAERFQTLVFVMSDLDLGMNNWMSNRSTYPEKPFDRGKVLDGETLERNGEWGRYKDVDGDGIPYRTLPGTDMPPYFTRGSGHNEKAQYSERPDDYVSNMDRLARKFETARTRAGPVVETQRGRRSASSPTARATGRSRSAAISCRAKAASRPATCGCAPIRSPRSSETFIDAHDRVYVVEQNRDGQMLGLMRLELSAERIAQAPQRPALQRPADRRPVASPTTSCCRKAKRCGRQHARRAPASRGTTGE